MVVRMRATHSHTRNRRSHHALKLAGLIACANCKALKLKHAMCVNCGMYKGRSVKDVASKVAKKAEKSKARAKADK